MTTLPGYDAWKTTPPDYLDDDPPVAYVDVPLAKLVGFALESADGLLDHIVGHVDADELNSVTVESVDTKEQTVTLRVEYTPTEDDLSDYYYDQARDDALEGSI